MIGVDTKALLRFYIEDEADVEAKKQRLATAKLFSDVSILFIPKSVLLESERVMRAVYEYTAIQVASVFHHFIELPQVRVEDPQVLDNALQAYEDGLDFADALHHATCIQRDSFATFDDRQIVRRATHLYQATVRTTPNIPRKSSWC